jgi:hypothetical protein
MEWQNLQSRIVAVEMHTKHLERRLKFTVYGWLSTLLLLLLCAWTLRPEATQQLNAQTDVLRVRQLVVVDAKGTDRIVIGSPLPDPQMMGKRLKRRSPGTGIQVNDANGNERTGLAILDDGSAVVGIDDESGSERAHLYYIPKRGSGLLVQGEKEGAKISLLIPPGQGSSASPKLEMTDQTGRIIAAIPAQLVKDGR